jgi:hypothetical protein
MVLACCSEVTVKAESDMTTVKEKANGMQMLVVIDEDK